MLSALSKEARVKGAVVLAMVYALCVLAPSAAIAVVAPDAVAHCLTVDHGFAAPAHHSETTHRHADGTAHQHSDNHAMTPPADNDGKGQGKTCCGLFSVVGIAGDPGYTMGAFTVASLLLPVLHETMSGRGPERINRPPIGLTTL
jgi:hypothetical protein